MSASLSVEPMLTVAHQETVGMAVFTAVFALILILAIAYQRRTGKRHSWFFPSLFGVALGVVLMVVTLSGTAIRGW